MTGSYESTILGAGVAKTKAVTDLGKKSGGTFILLLNRNHTRVKRR
jgi:hypothetical protein